MAMLLSFQVVQIILLGLFAVAISDFRRKKDMVPTVARGYIICLKCVYLAPLLIYASCLFSLEQVVFYDVLGLALTAAGTFLAVRAKIDLGKHHAWTGYHRDNTQIVTRGIYSYLRHPIYAGIVLFILGGLCTSLPRVSWPLALLGGATIAYIVVFLTLSARREARRLSIVHGDDYRDYKEQVHPFLPVTRYRDAA